MVAIIRWILFLLIGMPFQAVVYAIYPLIWAIWRIFIFKKVDKSTPIHWQHPDPNVGRATRMDGKLLANDDDHGVLTQYGFIGKEGMELLVDENGDFRRAVSEDGSHNYNGVSGDCVAVWAFAYVQLPEDQKPRERAVKAAWNYLKHLGTRSYDADNKGWVSNRCNNFGINYCPDSEAWKLGQPAAGPQFYTTSCLLAIASKESFLLKMAFWMHWLLMGGWFWAFSPAIYPKDGLWYIRDVTMKMLWVHREVFGDCWWIRMPMKRINESVVAKNALFEAMLGQELMELPEVTHAFFSQEKDASSSEKLYQNNLRASAYIKEAIRKIYEKAK